MANVVLLGNILCIKVTRCESKRRFHCKLFTYSTVQVAHIYRNLLTMPASTLRISLYIFVAIASSAAQFNHVSCGAKCGRGVDLPTTPYIERYAWHVNDVLI